VHFESFHSNPKSWFHPASITYHSYGFWLDLLSNIHPAARFLSYNQTNFMRSELKNINELVELYQNRSIFLETWSCYTWQYGVFKF